MILSGGVSPPSTTLGGLTPPEQGHSHEAT